MSPTVVRELFHPTVLTADRDEMAAWLSRVMGLPSMMQREFAPDPRRRVAGDYPADYVLFSWITDLWWYAADPGRFSLPAAQWVEPPAYGLAEWAWKIGDAEDVLKRFSRHGVRLLDLSGDVVTSVESMAHPISPDTHFVWTDPAQTGLSFELVDWPASRPGYAAGWRYPRPARDDALGLVPPRPSDDRSANPLGLTRSRWHTVVTEDLTRARWVVVDLLGGSVVEHQPGRREAPVLVVDLAGTILHYVTHDASGDRPAARSTSLFGREQGDTYQMITLGVRDLSVARHHLRAVGVRFAESTTRVTTYAEDGLGVSWGFVEDIGAP